MKLFKVYVKQRILFSTATKVNFYFILILVQNTLRCLIIFVIFLLLKVIVFKSAIQKIGEFYKINDVTKNIENILLVCGYWMNSKLNKRITI